MKTMTVIEQKYLSVSLIKLADVRTEHYPFNQVNFQPSCKRLRFI